MTDANSNCPYCGAPRCPVSNVYECGAWQYDTASTSGWVRDSSCYEREIAAMRELCDKQQKQLTGTTVAEFGKFSADVYWAKKHWEDAQEELADLRGQVSMLTVERDDLSQHYDAALAGQAAVRQQCEAQKAEIEREFTREIDRLRAEVARLREALRKAQDKLFGSCDYNEARMILSDALAGGEENHD